MVGAARYYGIKTTDHNPGMFIEDVDGIYSGEPPEYEYSYFYLERRNHEKKKWSDWTWESRTQFLKRTGYYSVYKHRKRKVEKHSREEYERKEIENERAQSRAE